MPTRLNATIKDLLQRDAAEELIAARHIAEPGAEQQVCQESAALTDEPALERSVRYFAAITKPTPENAVVTFGHFLEKGRQILRLMAVAAVDFQNPVTPRRHGFPISAHIGINDAAILRGPHDAQLRLSFLKTFEQAAGAIG